MASGTTSNGIYIEFKRDTFLKAIRTMEAIGLGDRTDAVIRKAIKAGLKPIEEEAKLQAPVFVPDGVVRRSRIIVIGLLKRTIHSVTGKTRRGLRGLWGRVQTGTREMLGISAGDKHYWPAAVEYGHASPGNAGGPKTTQPNPYMRRAYELAKGKAYGAFVRMFKHQYFRELRKYRVRNAA